MAYSLKVLLQGPEAERLVYWQLPQHSEKTALLVHPVTSTALSHSEGLQFVLHSGKPMTALRSGKLKVALQFVKISLHSGK